MRAAGGLTALEGAPGLKTGLDGWTGSLLGAGVSILRRLAFVAGAGSGAVFPEVACKGAGAEAEFEDGVEGFEK